MPASTWLDSLLGTPFVFFDGANLPKRGTWAFEGSGVDVSYDDDTITFTIAGGAEIATIEGVSGTLEQGAVLVGSGAETAAWTTRAKPVDANTVLLWAMNEAASPYANSGNGGALAMADSLSGAPFALQQTALFGTAPMLVNSNRSFITASSAIAPALGTSFTASVWVKTRAIVSGAYVFLRHRSGTQWSFPNYASFAIKVRDGSNNIYFNVTDTGGTEHDFNDDGAHSIPLNVWALISLTYDGTTLRGYINGNLVGSVAFSGTVDFTSSGAYELGGKYGDSFQFDGQVQYPRVEDGVRAVAEIRAEYKNGLGLFE